MTKIYSIVVFFLTFSFALSQEAPRFGITGGAHQSRIRGIHDRSEARTAPSFGAFAQFELSINKTFLSNGSLFFAPGIEYSMEGEEATPREGGINYYHDYIAVPLLFKYYFGQNKINEDKSFIAFFGPRFAYSINQETEGTIIWPLDIKANKNIAKFDFGGVIGFGYAFTRNIELFGKFYHGFLPIYPDYKRKRTFNYNYGVGLNILFK